MGGTDALLAARLAAGDDHALAEAFDRLASAVYGGALRVLGDGAAPQDVVQDVFVELWSHPDRYNPSGGPLRTYLIVLARHRAVDLVRSELRRMARQERHGRLTAGPPQPSPYEEVMAAEAASAVRAAVRLLPDAQRRVVDPPAAARAGLPGPVERAPGADRARRAAPGMLRWGEPARPTALALD